MPQDKKQEWRDWAYYVTRNPEVAAKIEAGLSKTASQVEAQVGAELYSRMKAALTSDLSPAAYAKAKSMAQDLARKQAGTLVSGLLQTELQKVSDVVAEGLKAGSHPYEMARKLDMVKGLDSARAAKFSKIAAYIDSKGLSPEAAAKAKDREYQKLLGARKKTIAQTEARFATATGREAAAIARGAKFKTWITVRDDRVSDLCAQNEAAGVIDINTPFPSGHGKPPGHPNCRCTLAYGSNPDQRKRMEERSKQRAERTALAREGQEVPALPAGPPLPPLTLPKVPKSVPAAAPTQALQAPVDIQPANLPPPRGYSSWNDWETSLKYLDQSGLQAEAQLIGADLSAAQAAGNAAEVAQYQARLNQIKEASQAILDAPAVVPEVMSREAVDAAAQAYKESLSSASLETLQAEAEATAKALEGMARTESGFPLAQAKANAAAEMAQDAAYQSMPMAELAAEQKSLLAASVGSPGNPAVERQLLSANKAYAQKIAAGELPPVPQEILDFYKGMDSKALKSAVKDVQSKITTLEGSGDMVSAAQSKALLQELEGITKEAKAAEAAAKKAAKQAAKEAAKVEATPPQNLTPINPQITKQAEKLVQQYDLSTQPQKFFPSVTEGQWAHLKEAFPENLSKEWADVRVKWDAATKANNVAEATKWRQYMGAIQERMIETGTDLKLIVGESMSSAIGNATKAQLENKYGELIERMKSASSSVSNLTADHWKHADFRKLKAEVKMVEQRLGVHPSQSVFTPSGEFISPSVPPPKTAADVTEKLKKQLEVSDAHAALESKKDDLEIAVQQAALGGNKKALDKAKKELQAHREKMVKSGYLPGHAGKDADAFKSYAEAVQNGQISVNDFREKVAREATLRENQALHYYRASGYTEINTSIREGVTSGRGASMGNLMENTANRYRTTEDMTLYRGVRGGYGAELRAKALAGELDGDVVYDPAFSSTSVNPLISEQNFASSGVMFELKVPKGTAYIPGTDYEEEFILQRDANIYVERVENRRGITYIIGRLYHLREK